MFWGSRFDQCRSLMAPGRVGIALGVTIVSKYIFVVPGWVKMCVPCLVQIDHWWFKPC